MVDNRHKKSKKVENKKITTTGIFLRKNSNLETSVLKCFRNNINYLFQ